MTLDVCYEHFQSPGLVTLARYKAILAYDGTEFRGFQRQARARTVQSAVESALKSIGWQGDNILAAGRTDTGVHAAGQAVAFDLEWIHTPDDLSHAINAGLPQDVAVRSVVQVSQDFHPRYDATCRHYQYRIVCEPTRQPLRERYVWRVWPAVSLSVLRQSAAVLVGEHDFAPFGTPPRKGGSTIRRVFSADWLEKGPELVFDISGNGFLYRMVRRLVNLQIQIAQGVLPMEHLHLRIDGQDSRMVQGLAPAHGLTLMEVIYPEKIPGKN
jgi:tRNA pseudouridine38-40 synthase